VLVFLLAIYFCKEVILFTCGGMGPVIGDVLQFRIEIGGLFLEGFIIVS
jgi:hypothetical protein